MIPSVLPQRRGSPALCGLIQGDSTAKEKEDRAPKQNSTTEHVTRRREERRVDRRREISSDVDILITGPQSHEEFSHIF